MTKLYGFAAWFCTSLGIALLVCSVVLVPDGAVWGQSGDPGYAICLFCSEDNCQANQSPPGCPGTCTGWACPSACVCKAYDAYYCYCN
jgi:hypothetical protein